MNVNLTGLLQDGLPQRAGVEPTDARHEIEMSVGTDLTINLSVIDPVGRKLDWSTVVDVTLTVKKLPEMGPKLVKHATIQGSQAIITIGANDMRQFRPGNYVYDIWVTRALQGRDAVVPLSIFRLLPSATDIPGTQAPSITLVAGDISPTAINFGQDITGWTVQFALQYLSPLVKTATILNAQQGKAQVNWAPSDLVAGTWNAYVKVTLPGPDVEQSSVLVVDVLTPPG